MNARSGWSRGLMMVGSIAMAVGTLDPLEGSVLIIPGSGLVALGSYLDADPARYFRDDLTIFILIAFGGAFIWGFTFVGGIGEGTPYSMWWALTMLPLPIGLLLGWVVMVKRIVRFFKARRQRATQT